MALNEYQGDRRLPLANLNFFGCGETAASK